MASRLVQLELFSHVSSDINFQNSDKNSHRVEEATERFKEIQNAYTILNDPNERAWYEYTSFLLNLHKLIINK